jgi:hypothetical protein
LFRLKPSRYITPKVPSSDSGTQTVGTKVGLEIAQEQEHHQDHQDGGKDQADFDIVHRVADRGGGVEQDALSRC